MQNFAGKGVLDRGRRAATASSTVRGVTEARGTTTLAVLSIALAVLLSSIPVLPDHWSPDATDRARSAAGEDGLLTWFKGGYFSESWVELHLDANNSVQLAFVTLSQAGNVTGYTTTNASVSESSISNVNKDLAYFNHSLSSDGDVATYVYQFTRTADAYGDPQINLTASCTSNTNFSRFNITLGVINLYTDSGIDTDWWLQVYGNATITPYFWASASDNVASYHGLKTDNNRMILITTNSGNFWQHIQPRIGNVITMAGYWSTLVNNQTWAKEYDVDGRLFGAFKVVTPQPKQRYGNVLMLLPCGNTTMLHDVANNESIYSKAASVGITHVYMETFDIIPGLYAFASEAVAADVQQARTYSHQYGMKFILPNFWWAFTGAGPNPLTEYNESTRNYILSAWQNYLINQGNLTDEYSIGYADIWFSYGSWSWWNLDMLQEALSMVPTQKETSLWSKQMWFTDESMVYLNTEAYQNWSFNKLDAYYAHFIEHDIEPGYEMCGMKTWAFTSQVTMEADYVDLWTQTNYSFERRVISEAFHHGAGLTVFYHEEFYSGRDGFSLAYDYLNGLTEDMVVTGFDVPGLSNGTLYEGAGAIMLTGDGLTSSPIELNQAPTTYVGVHCLDSSHALMCNISFPSPYPIFISPAWEDDCVIAVSVSGATLGAIPGVLYTVLPMTCLTDGTAEVTTHDFSPGGPRIASWTTSTSDSVTYSLTRLDGSVGHRVYQDGVEIVQQKSGYNALTFMALGGGDFEVWIWQANYTQHDPIHINGNEEFTSGNGVVSGSGTVWDPYIIEGWDINASIADGISILNTDAHFIIRGCYVHDGRSFGYFNGIMLLNCVNGTLRDNVCTNNSLGIALGMSRNNTLYNNNCSGNVDGISLSLASNGNILNHNNCSLNTYTGISLESSSGNTVLWNRFCDNQQYGVHIHSGSLNAIWGNDFYRNNGAGDAYDPLHSQAYDDGSDNAWNSTDCVGNHWSDWTAPDKVPVDGIVDSPYVIAGSAAAEDSCPLASAPPEPIPEFDLVLVVPLILLSFLLLARRRRAGRPFV